MIINKTFKQIIKIKDLAYINELGCEIVEYYPNNNTLVGKVYITGAYHSSKTDEVKLVSEDVDFLFDLENDDFYIEDIECINFDYSVLEGVGLDVTFEVKLDLDISEEINSDKRGEVETSNQEVLTYDDEESLNNEIELIKKEINKEVDLKLSEKLEIVNDNIPQDVVVFRSIKDENSVIKVIYFNEEKELNEIAKNNNITLESIFKANKKTDFNNKKRIIINYGK